MVLDFERGIVAVNTQNDRTKAGVLAALKGAWGKVAGRRFAGTRASTPEPTEHQTSVDEAPVAETASPAPVGEAPVAQVEEPVAEEPVAEAAEEATATPVADAAPEA